MRTKSQTMVIGSGLALILVGGMARATPVMPGDHEQYEPRRKNPFINALEKLKTDPNMAHEVIQMLVQPYDAQAKKGISLDRHDNAQSAQWHNLTTRLRAARRLAAQQEDVQNVVKLIDWLVKTGMPRISVVREKGIRVHTKDGVTFRRLKPQMRELLRTPRSRADANRSGRTPDAEGPRRRNGHQ